MFINLFPAYACLFLVVVVFCFVFFVVVFLLLFFFLEGVSRDLLAHTYSILYAKISP